RGPEFAALLVAITRALQDFLRTQNDVFLLTSSGSGAMEAAVANTLARGDRVLVFSNGAFGERFHQIARAYGVDARRIDVTWGRDDLVRASQKAWGAPPGIAMITMSPRAWKAYDRSDLPKAYFDLQAAKSYLEKGSTPATPAVSLVVALQEALRLMSEEGLEGI